MHWTTLDDVQSIADRLNTAAAKAADFGLRVGYHNHWWELEHRFEGRTALDQLVDRLDPRVVLEVDAYWVAVGGVDPVEYVASQADRVRFLHLKDGPVTRDNKQQVPAGQGSMPLAGDHRGRARTSRSSSSSSTTTPATSSTPSRPPARS